MGRRRGCFGLCMCVHVCVVGVLFDVRIFVRSVRNVKSARNVFLSEKERKEECDR